MLNKLKNFKNRLLNSGSWREFFASCFIDLDKLNKELEGQTETQQIKILKDALGKQNSKVQELIEMIAKQNEQIEELTNENQNLKEQIKDYEEIETITETSNDTSLSSSSSKIDEEIAKIDQEIIYLQQKTKKSTAPQRKIKNLLNKVKKLKWENKAKDLRIKELETTTFQNDNIALSELENEIDGLIGVSQNNQENLNRVFAQIEVVNQKLK